jgi:hypothetical protein
LRCVLTFALSGIPQQQNLLHELALHDGVVADAIDSVDHVLLRVEIDDSHQSVWDVRSTVSEFDDRAVEVSAVDDEQSA